MTTSLHLAKLIMNEDWGYSNEKSIVSVFYNAVSYLELLLRRHIHI